MVSDSLLDLTDDLDAAGKAGKRLAVVWELRGCPYCKEMHLVNFARPDIADYVKSRFEILQLNIRGDRTVTDFDGEQVAEKRLATKYQVRFTPTIQFFPETVGELARTAADRREVFRIPGYLKPDDFLAVFRFVAERGYDKGSLRGLPAPAGVRARRRRRLIRRTTVPPGARGARRFHSITSSALASSEVGTVRPSIRAVWALMTSSNLLDCTTGRSAGFAPLRTRPV